MSDRARLRRFACLAAAASALGAGTLASEERAPRATPEILAWAVAQGALGDGAAEVEFYPIGFSESGRFATLKRTSGYRGECSEQECPSGYHLLVYALATGEILDALWVDELLTGPRVREPNPAAESDPALPLVTPGDVERLLHEHGIARKSFRRVKPAANGVFRAGGADFRLEDRSPCLVEDEAAELPDACQDEQPYETVLTKLGTGSAVVTRYSSVGLLWHQRRIGFVVDVAETRLAIAYETVQFHEGQGIVDGSVVGAPLGGGFEKSDPSEPPEAQSSAGTPKRSL